MSPSLKLRLRLRTLLLLVAVLCIPLGWLGYELGQYRREQSALVELEQKGAVTYYSSPMADFLLEENRISILPSLRGALRERMSIRRVVELEVYPEQLGEEQLKRIREEPGQLERRVRALQAFVDMRSKNSRIPFASAEAELLPKLPELRVLDLSYTRVSDEDLQYVGRLHRLVLLKLQGTSITDTGLSHLRPLQQLRELNIGHTEITDAGFAHLISLTSLRILRANRNQGVKDNGLLQLAEMEQLEYLGLWDTSATDAGVTQLRAALPNCDVHYESTLPLRF